MGIQVSISVHNGQSQNIITNSKIGRQNDFLSRFEADHGVKKFSINYRKHGNLKKAIINIQELTQASTTKLESNHGWFLQQFAQVCV